MKTVVVIMANGKGERFWPMSRKNMPKQFLKLTDSDLTMLQLTVQRIKKLIDLDDIYIVATEEHKDIVYSQISELKKENVLLVPATRNTAPVVAYASSYIKNKYGDANVIILASDHVINNTERFIETMQTAIKSLDNNNIVTLGIVPTRVETGYGYIELGEKTKTSQVYSVNRFVEKPNYEVAKEYYESGKFLWNSGMFLWRNSHIMSCFEKYSTETYKYMQEIFNNLDNPDFKTILNKVYYLMKEESIDYAIMEKVDNILVIPCKFSWDDVGSFLALTRTKKADENNNVINGNTICIDNKDSIILNNQNDILIATVGLENCVVVCNDNAILVINKDNIGDIKKVTQKLKNMNNDQFL